MARTSHLAEKARTGHPGRNQTSREWLSADLEPFGLIVLEGPLGHLDLDDSEPRVLLACHPPPRSSHGLGFRLDPGSKVWRDIASGASAKPPKRSTSNPADRKKTKRTKPNPALSLESKRRSPHASNEGTKASKRIKPLPAVSSAVSPPSPSQRKTFMGHRPNIMHYPPPNKRGHSGTGYSSSDTSSQDSASYENGLEVEVEVRKEVFGLLSIGEKFAILSRPPTLESTMILQTKRCFSMCCERSRKREHNTSGSIQL